jgi:rabenosyn-5
MAHHHETSWRVQYVRRRWYVVPGGRFGIGTDGWIF